MSPDRVQCARPSLFRINTRRAQAGFRVLRAMAAGAGAPVVRCAQAIGRRRGIDGCSQDEFRTRAPGKNYKSIITRTSLGTAPALLIGFDVFSNQFETG
jgi:hypothetical protein